MDKFFINVVRNNYANFSGRTSRKEFLMFVAACGVIIFSLYILAIIIVFIEGLIVEYFITPPYSLSPALLVALLSYVPLLLFILVILMPTCAIMVRRMHDVGRNGWYILVPVMALLWVLSDGKKEENQYGPEPEAFEMPSTK